MMVAVEMITYNHERYIRQAIESVLMQQTNFDVCLYIFEDCSTDNTAAICKEYAAKYPNRISLSANTENVGVTKNAKIMHDTTFSSSAKYIAMCEGDDYWTDPLKLQKQVDFLEGHPEYAMCFHRAQELLNGTFTLSNQSLGAQEASFTLKDLAERNFIHTPTVVYRRQNVENLPVWFNQSPVGDYPVYFLNARNGLIHYFPEPMAVYRIHTGGVWSTLARKKILQNWQLVLNFLLQETMPDDVRAVFKNQKHWIDIEYLWILYEENEKLFVTCLKEYAINNPELIEIWATQEFPRYIRDLKNTRSFKLAQNLVQLKRKAFKPFSK